jgi:glucose-1-phosphatase
MHELSNKIKAVVFDLGGVIVDLAVDNTIRSFAKLSGLSATQIQEAYIKYPGFFAYEKGEITDNDFRQMLRLIFAMEADDEELDKSWNAMLVDLPQKKLQLLSTLKSRVQVYALSNTNNIHINYVNNVMLKGSTLDVYFHQCFYSHKVNMRKPESEIYKHVLRATGFKPNEILFLDDNIVNVRAAFELGIHAQQIKHPDEVYKILNGI